MSIMLQTDVSLEEIITKKKEIFRRRESNPGLLRERQKS